MRVKSVSNAFALIVLCIAGLTSVSVSAQILGLNQPPEAPVTDIQDIPHDEIDQYLATLTDSQARRLLLSEIKSRPEAPQPSMMDRSYIAFAIMSISHRFERFESESSKIFSASQRYRENLSRIFDNMFYRAGTNTAPRAALLIAALLGLGFVVVSMVFRPLRQTRQKLREDTQSPVYARLGQSGTGMILDLLKVGLFVLITVPLTFIFFDNLDPVRVLASSMLFLVAAVWAISNILKEMLFSPVSRDLYIKHPQSRLIYYWAMMGFFGPVLASLLLHGLLTILEFPFELMRLNSLGLASLSIISLIIGVILIAREKRNHYYAQNGILFDAVSNNKYWLIIAILIGFYLLGVVNIVNAKIHDPLAAAVVHQEAARPGYVFFALVLFIFMPLYLRLMYLLVNKQPLEAFFAADEGAADKSVSPSFADIKPHKWARILFIMPYTILIFLFTVEGANIGLLYWFSEGAGASFGQAASGVFVATMLGVISWNIVNAAINKRLPDIALDPKALMDSEGGGDEAATRMQTVLPIARNFSLTLIIVLVAFSVLSSIGVNTGPLLAGAGVIGIAIGFGAQKLVQDIVSGVFFLFEDAFRIGEYIDTGTLVGTVESTSVRSLKLRHHLGAVQTVPYSEIRAVKNLSRDFVIMKLTFRVPFDTDIDLVRRTIKKVGVKLLEHEELGDDFIAPLKSQGVQTAEDDALVIRMKFTSKPGKQWMIKREAYRLVQEALALKGIQFASRQVTVHVPANEQLDEKSLQAAAAIAAETPKTDQTTDPLADR